MMDRRAGGWDGVRTVVEGGIGVDGVIGEIGGFVGNWRADGRLWGEIAHVGL